MADTELLRITNNPELDDDHLNRIKVKRSKSADECTTNESKQHFSATPANVCQIYEYYGATELHLACILRNINFVSAIICQTKDSEFFDIQNFEGHTALHLAALTEQVNILRMLLLAGANPNLRDHNGNTGLHLACMTNNKEAVSTLITPFGEIDNKLGSFGNAVRIVPTDLEVRNYNGQRCIHLAAEAGSRDILRILLNSGADINAREGIAGRTALHIAIEMNNDDLFSFILKEYLTSLNLITASYAGHTVYQAALRFKKSEFYNLIKTSMPLH